MGVLPERAARLAPSGSGTTVVDLPFGMGPLVESLLRHPLHERDPAHIWLRKIAAEAGHLVAASHGRDRPPRPQPQKECRKS
ncbi:type 2 periplasmic-binding domain-containing protein [Streptomyces humidus]|uniref:hypothetical protein n=1 Tax=Streptomyces humidus TaxID=52259 RepID=UPI0033349AAB